MNMKLMQLSDVAKIYTGLNLKSPKTAFGQGDCPWVMVEDLQQGAVVHTARRLTPEGMKAATPQGHALDSRPKGCYTPRADGGCT